MSDSESIPSRPQRACKKNLNSSSPKFSASQPVKRNLESSTSPQLSSSQPAKKISTDKNSFGMFKPSVISLESIYQSDQVDKLITLIEGLNERFNKFDAKIDKIEKTVEQLQEQVYSVVPPVNLEVSIEAIKIDIESIKSNVLSLSKPDGMSTQEALQDLAMETNTEINAQVKTKLKDVIPDVESSCIKPRADAFYRYLNNGDRLDIHQQWLKADPGPVFIPPNYLPTKLKYVESDAEYKIRKSQKLKDLDHYMELLHVKRDTAKASYENIDQKVYQKIDEEDITIEAKAVIKEEYDKQIRENEERSKNSWEKRKKGIEAIKDRASERILIEGDRKYRFVSKKVKDVPVAPPPPKPKNKPGNIQKKNKGKVDGNIKTATGQSVHQYPHFNGMMPNLCVPPPQYPFHWMYPPITQK